MVICIDEEAKEKAKYGNQLSRCRLPCGHTFKFYIYIVLYVTFI